MTVLEEIELYPTWFCLPGDLVDLEGRLVGLNFLQDNSYHISGFWPIVDACICKEAVFLELI